MKSPELRVIKLGGSLLDWDRWPFEFHRWLAAQLPARNILIVGGGKMADAIRDFDGRHRLPAETAHRLAVRTMSITAHLASALIDSSRVFERLDEAITADAELLAIFDPFHFLAENEPKLGGHQLPRDWCATSDSIAARVAEIAGADELVLIKSTLPEGCRHWQDAANAGYVDAHFPFVVQALPVARCVNLRNPQSSPWQPCEETQAS